MAYVIKLNDLYVHRSPFRYAGGNFKLTNNLYDAMRFTRERDARNKVFTIESVIKFLKEDLQMGSDWLVAYTKKKLEKHLSGFDINKPYTINIKRFSITEDKVQNFGFCVFQDSRDGYWWLDIMLWWRDVSICLFKGKL